MKFPWEVVTEVEMHLWCTAVTQVVAAGPERNRLGAYNEEGHKIWEWRICDDAGQLYRCNSDTIKVMQHVRQVRYGTPRESRSRQMRGDYGTVKKSMPGVWKVCSVASGVVHTSVGLKVTLLTSF
jgi:hypothetical protein